MKQGSFIFLIVCFSYMVSAEWFSSEMSIEEKIKLTHQIKEQFMRNAPLVQTGRRSSYKKRQVVAGGFPSRRDYRNIKMILGLPLENRKQSLSNYDSSKVFIVLKHLVFSNKEKMPIRWKALTSLARLYPEQSFPLVQKSLRSSLWFLRNAGLIAMEILDPEEGVRWAGQLLNDPALIVRTAAVSMIKKHKAGQYKFHLLQKLNAPDSFHKNRSLWIRHHIVSTLVDFCEPGEEKMFVSFLQDPDERLHPSAITALEKITGKTFRYSDEKKEVRAKAQTQMWISWWSDFHSDKKDSAASL